MNFLLLSRSFERSILVYSKPIILRYVFSLATSSGLLARPIKTLYFSVEIGILKMVQRKHWSEEVRTRCSKFRFHRPFPRVRESIIESFSQWGTEMKAFESTELLAESEMSQSRTKPIGIRLIFQLRVGQINALGGALNWTKPPMTHERWEWDLLHRLQYPCNLNPAICHCQHKKKF